MGALGTRARIVVATTLPLLAALLGVMGYASAAGVQAFTVDSTADAVDAAPGDGRCATAAGACTLRAAVQEVEALPVVPGAGREIVVPAGLYRLTIPAGGELTSSQPVVAAGDLDVTKRVTITGAGADRTVVDGNNAHRMVDVHGTPGFPDGFARISRIALRNGRAENSGPTGHVHGGAIHNHGVLELLESTVSDSVAQAGSPWGGGGITNAGNGTATLRNVTIAKNGTTYFGGAIENGGPMTMTNVTVTANTAPAGQGAGIASGVGFFGGSGAAAASLQSTIVSGNGPGGNDCRDRPSPTVTSNGNNLQGAGTCPFLHPNDPIPANPQLVEIPGAQGSVFVYGLSPGSPAIDRSFTCPPIDERGVTRPQEGDGVSPALCDIGAYELEPPGSTCDGATATVVGTAGRDRLRGTDGPDVIVGLGDDDRIDGRGGDDRICGGDGRDRIDGGPGADRIFGDADDDDLSGGPDVDFIDGGDGRDRCRRSTSTVRCEDVE